MTTTVPKSIRNKALRGCSRLITAIETNTGAKWYCPDGYFATTIDIYDGYKVKKEQEIPVLNPKFEYILDRLTDTPVRARVGKTNGDGFTPISYGNTTVMVQENFMTLLNKLHDNPELRIDVEQKYAPVQMYKNNKLVALLMPIRNN